MKEEDVDYVIVNSAFYGRFYNGAIDRHLPETGLAGRRMHDVIESNMQLLVQFLPRWEDQPGPVIKIYQVPKTFALGDDVLEDVFDPYPSMDRQASAVGYYQFAPR